MDIIDSVNYIDDVVRMTPAYPADIPLPQAAATVRRFNRFYTRQMGLLDQELHRSGRSLTEARVLYELAHNEHLTAADLVSNLEIDAGYLSRMLKKFESQDLIGKTASQKDKRASFLYLTDKGRHCYETLDRLSQGAAEALLSAIEAPKRHALLGAMQNIQSALAAEPEAPILLRPHRTGDMGWIVYRQAELYAREYGWDNSYEALICEIAAQFLREYKPLRERCWIAEKNACIVGSVFLIEAAAEIAKLRLLYVEPGVRGQGLGRRLVDECIQFARERGYRRLELWTNHVLVAARRIYESAGFELVREEPHHSFGHDLIGQTWALDLTRAK